MKIIIAHKELCEMLSSFLDVEISQVTVKDSIEETLEPVKEETNEDTQLAELKEKAKALGVDIRGRLSAETIQERINEKLAEQEEEETTDTDTDIDFIPDDEEEEVDIEVEEEEKKPVKKRKVLF